MTPSSLRKRERAAWGFVAPSLLAIGVFFAIPAIDLVASSTRRDDLLMDDVTTQRMWILRKYLSEMNPVEAMEFVNKNIRGTLNNEEFLMSMNK